MIISVLPDAKTETNGKSVEVKIRMLMIGSFIIRVYGSIVHLLDTMSTYFYIWETLMYHFSNN